jgi:hypothetical protein
MLPDINATRVNIYIPLYIKEYKRNSVTLLPLTDVHTIKGCPVTAKKRKKYVDFSKNP